MRPFAILLVPLFLSSCDFFSQSEETLQLSGETMGTTYHITVVDAPDEADEETLSAAVEATLAAVNAKMSNWDPNSEVSTFNKTASTAPIAISAEFAQVMQASNQINGMSGGRFDVTVAPLINLWGFGPKKPGEPIPSDDEIATALEDVGQATLLTLSSDPLTLTKGRPGVTVNLSAIAKGYGIDAVAATLAANGVERYLVEIGGDLVAKGENAEGAPWSIGIESPDASQETIEKIVPVSDLGLATSGDYRNYIEEDGIRYSHIIDPTTGRPITHKTSSVTVLADNAMMADGLATALLALGVDDGMALAESEGIAVFFISRGEDGFVTASSSAFEKLTADD